MIYVFGDYELDTRLYELRHAGTLLKLEPKVFHVLAYLVQHHDRVVSKRELIEHLWSNQFISGTTLTHCVMAVRKAIGDSGRKQRIIKTVHSHGYRFVARVEQRLPVATPRAAQQLLSLLPPGRQQAPGSDARCCVACQHVNDTDATFCVACGMRLLDTCSQCSQTVSMPAAFCPFCGQRLEEQSLARTRRLVQPRLSPFVGRSRELALLEEIVTQLQTGQGQIVGLVGEPGMGKSRLLSEFRHSIRDRRLVALSTHCLSYGGTIPYLAVCDIIRQYCRITETDSRETMTAKVQQRLHEVGLEPEAGTPYLLRLLGVQDSSNRLVALPPETAKVQAFTTLSQLLLRSSRQQPLLLVVENLHCIDQASEEWLALLAESLANAPILLLTTFHPDYRPAWMEKSYATEVVLSPLPPHESLHIVQAILPQPSLPDPLMQDILAEAKGNPLGLEELTWMVLEHGTLQSDMVLPNVIHKAIAARLDCLPDHLQRLVQAAAVLGQTGSIQLLNHIWQGPEDLATALQALGQRAWCDEQQSSVGPVCVFRHALIQEMAYKSLLPAARQALHTAAARALEMCYAEHLDEVYDLLAYHYAKTAQTTKAIAYLTRFAERAVTSFAHAEAVTAWQEALVHTQRLPVEQRDRSHLELVLCQAQSLVVLGRLQEAMVLLQQQQTRLDRLQEAQLTGRYALLGSQISSALRQWPQAVQHAQHAVQAAIVSHDDATLGQAYYVLAAEQYRAGQPLRGIEHGQRAVSLLRQFPERFRLGMAYYLLGLNYCTVGAFEPALQAARHARAIGEAIGDPHLQALSACMAGWVHTTQGEWPAGIMACQRGLDSAPDALTAASALGWLGYAYLENGELAEARPRLEQAVQRLCRFGYRRLQGWYTTLLGQTMLLLGDADTARTLARQGLDLSTAATDRTGIGWAQRLLGQIAQANAALAQAEHHIRAALDSFAALPAHFEVGRTYLALAELAHRRGHRDMAVQHLAEAHRLFTDLRVPTYVARIEQCADAFRLSEAGPVA